MVAKYRGSFAVIGVSVDANAKTLKAYLAENPLPWQQIFEEGGQDSRPANALGIITVPTMILVDARGQGRESEHSDGRDRGRIEEADPLNDSVW